MPVPGPFTLLREDTLFSFLLIWFLYFFLFVSHCSKDFKMMLLYISEALPSIGERPWWQKPDKSPNAWSKLGPPRRWAQPRLSPVQLSVFHPQRWWLRLPLNDLIGTDGGWSETQTSEVISHSPALSNQHWYCFWKVKCVISLPLAVTSGIATGLFEWPDCVRHNNTERV